MLGSQPSMSFPGISTKFGMVFIMVLLPRRGMAWRDATMPVVMALLAQWWFTNYPARHGLTMAIVIILCPPGGVVAIVREEVAALGLLVIFASCSAGGLDLGLRGRGPWWLG